MMDFTLDYASLAKKLEWQELESPGGRVSPQLYSQLLAIHLLFNDLTSAKFLWKRIPNDIKHQNKELSTTWTVGKLMWKRNYSEIYDVIQNYPTWPKHLKNIMNLILETTRQRAIDLVARAYSSVQLGEVAKLVGLSEEDTLKLAQRYGWTYESETGYILIEKLNDQLSYNKQTPSTAGNIQAARHSNTTNPGSNTVCKPSSVVTLDNGTELLEKLTDYILFLEKTTAK